MYMYGLLVLILSITIKTSLAFEVTYVNLEKLNTPQQNKVKNWVAHGINSTFKTLGPLTQQTLPVILKPRYFAFEPVPWASVKRGIDDNIYDAIELHFHRYASEKALIYDWSLYHELSHLYHPLFAYKDFWLSEGLATYLQNIVMLENGIINHNEFKARLKAGLKRGQQQTNRIKGPLNQVANNMWALGAQQRVYWSGVAFFIHAQLELKKHTGKYKTIADVIRQYQQCCKRSTHSAKQFLAQLDKLSKSAVFSTLYHQYSYRMDFPNISTKQLNQLLF
ncbi:hypothetical protein PSECIP111854_02191 [Pseudoalteromonas sp. CIP111854]|uniref:Peptidase M61 catalytic domain-containing protein n=1 Tax=Pseudoalteromonas holothuriae TaxID=2963714 RepID=A0A9W4QYF5_9GAMM|nr:hypothetical protein [Pseudoalteromonas sp. CIP111854]CAH9058384.1 hypothetical protein PSECIP111854_02191 [Pseudoalteromonas sp. CIP111854]